MDISTFSSQTKITKMCPKHLLTLHQNLSPQYLIQINRIGDINNVKNQNFTLYANKIMTDCPICIVIPNRARLDIVIYWLACQTLELEGQGRFTGGHLLHFFLFLFSLCNAKLLHTNNMELNK